MLPSFGPLAHYFDQRTEVTYSYDPLELTRYEAFIGAMQANPALRKDLNISRWLDRKTGNINVLADPLPRANFPKQVVPMDQDAVGRLTTLDPAGQALVPPGTAVTAQDPNAAADVREFTPGHYKIHFHCATPSLLRVGNAYFPGWAAELGSQQLPVIPVDHALIGVLVPAGEGDLRLDYHSTYFLPAASVSLVSLAICAGLLLLSRRRSVPRASSEPHPGRAL